MSHAAPVTPPAPRTRPTFMEELYLSGATKRGKLRRPGRCRRRVKGSLAATEEGP